MKKLFFIYFIFVFNYLYPFENIDLEIRFLNQSYRLNESIPIVIRVINNSDSPFTFYVSSLIYETFFLIVRTPDNKIINTNDLFVIEMLNNKSTPSDYRKITLNPQESFTRAINLGKWFDFKEEGYYYIKGLFFPDPNKRNCIESLDYRIQLKSPEIVDSKILEDIKSKEIIMKEIVKLPPYDVVADFLEAKNKKDWERFLLHIDAEKLIKAFDDYYQAYLNATSGKYRLEIIEDFKRYLTTHWQDRILSFVVKETYIKENDARVVADVEYKVRFTSYTMRYNFELYRNDLGQWLIYNYYAVRIR